MLTRYWKDPAAILSYTINWSNESLPTGDTIVSSYWVVSDGLTLASASSTTTTATAWLSGGERGKQYKATNRVITTDGRRDERTLTIIVEDQ